jgi:hypothetical protein
MQVQNTVLNKSRVWLQIYYYNIEILFMKFRSRIFKWVILSILFIGGTGAFIGYKMLTKPHRDVASATAIKVTASAIAGEYESNETQSNAKYLDKVLEVNGEVSEVSKNQKGETVIGLKGSDMSGLMCTVEGALTTEVKSGEVIAIKGICTGYLTDVVLVRCTVQAK